MGGVVVMPSSTSWIWIYLLQHPKVYPKWWTGYLEVKEGFLSASHWNCFTLQRAVKCSVGQWERASILLWFTGQGTCLGGWESGSWSASAASLCGSTYLENKVLCILYKGVLNRVWWLSTNGFEQKQGAELSSNRCNLIFISWLVLLLSGLLNDSVTWWNQLSESKEKKWLLWQGKVLSW